MDKDFLDVSVIWHHFTGAANINAKAKYITLQNPIGPFNILPGHANLISVVYNSILLGTTEGKTEVYFFTRGIIEVHANSVKVFLEGKIE